jgi:lipopolysaccharide transport system permease protein
MLSRRNVESRYKGSVLGLVWSFVQPLLMMTVYTVVFGVFFGAKWPGEIGRNPWAYTVLVLCGMSTFSIFSESGSGCCQEYRRLRNNVKETLGSQCFFRFR